ncbi:protein FAR1-RELATED SEQUENCE 9 isoform X3 [Setaria italica]|uniref:protein FAR1-RELATED SEQUENCE 9 isoform X3 n=1 Tax=Setaria italica TaxID=4555 RepID=UPI0007199E5D|nr:protein FAR1-RELATED SEQUENCE 9 isoform X3 [Setaria italica]XP_022680029.1 protein FAR1-RELATED SEQUENCE 9 isoform X3 [Setaria italica]
MDSSQDSQEERHQRRENGEETEKAADYGSALSRKEATEELLGCIVHSEEEAYRLYCDYGHRIGFSVRKGKQSYFIGTKNIRTKDYYCSKEGLKYDEPVTEANFNRPDTRTNCKAMIRFRVDEKGRWTVIRFVPVHNHQLAKPGERHMLRSAKSLAFGKSGVIDPSASTESHPINGFSDTIEGDTADNSGYTIRECYNQVGMQGITVIEAGDGQSLVSYFKRRTNEEGMFYWDVQVDQEGRMTNFFYRDGKCRNDYGCFGDAIIFDTTYRTNKYNLICAPFVGVDHHWQNVVFGCAFLLDESVASYVWLFKSFLESMGGKSPKSIFTDQDEAIMQAVEQVSLTHTLLFLLAYSEECTISFSSLNTSQAFQHLFMQGSDSEEDFEESWTAMLREYKLQDNSWLNDLHRFRHKWCSALNKDTFDGGINSSQWGEVSNNILSGISDENTSLTRFALLLEKVVKDLRRNESEEDFRCSQTAPVRAVKHSTVLKQAAESYTHRIYKLFEAEFLDGCGATSCHETSSGGNLLRFEITMQGRGSKVWAVALDTSTMEITCGCRKFERMGLLCSHALKVFTLQNVDTIPEKYVLKRWTKDARRSMFKLAQDDSTQQECTEAELAYRNRAMQYAYNLIMKSQELEESRKIFWDSLETGEKALEVFFEMRNMRTQAAKDASNREKKKKKPSKGPNSKKAKQAPAASSAGLELIVQTNEHQYQPSQDAQGNATIGRPYYYQQAFPTAPIQPNQMYMHPNVHTMPLCTSQDHLPAYAAIRPNSNFGGAKNI